MRKYKRGPDRVARVLLARTADDRRRCHRSKLITRSLTIVCIVPSLRIISSTQRPRNATLLLTYIMIEWSARGRRRYTITSLGVTISAGSIKTRAPGARVASAQRQGRVTRRTMTRREFFIHLRAHDNFQRSLRVLDRVRGSVRAKLAKPRESRH